MTDKLKHVGHTSLLAVGLQRAERACRKVTTASTNITRAIRIWTGRIPAPNISRSITRSNDNKPTPPRNTVNMYQTIFIRLLFSSTPTRETLPFVILWAFRVFSCSFVDHLCIIDPRIHTNAHERTHILLAKVRLIPYSYRVDLKRMKQLLQKAYRDR